MKGLVLFFFLLPAIGLATPVIYEKQYHGFTVWLDCAEHGAVAFKYDLDTDTGDVSRAGRDFHPDPSVPSECQPTTGDSYRTDTVDTAVTGTYDRGHLVPANHMNGELISITDTFFVTNILPQQSTFNLSSGAWFKTGRYLSATVISPSSRSGAVSSGVMMPVMIFSLPRMV